MMYRFSILLVLAGCVLASCTSSPMMSLEARKNAFGKAGELMVITDGRFAEAGGRDSVDYYYGAAYPILPQPEPMHDLRFITPWDMVQKPALRQLRAYLIAADLSDTASATTKMVIEDIGKTNLAQGFEEGRDYQLKTGKNKWADQQILFYVIGRHREGLVEGIQSSVALFGDRLFEFDKKQYEANLFSGGNDKEIEARIKETFGVSLRIPERFAIGVEEDNFLWLQDVEPKVTGGLFLTRLPYRDRSQFSQDSILSLRDRITSSRIEGPSDSSYMVVNVRDLPVFQYGTKIGGQYAQEIRGIWEMKNEFMGGSYISYLIQYPNNEDLLFLDIFVYGPGQKKREALKQLIYIAEGLKFA